MLSSPGDKTWHRRLTQNRTGVRRDEICMAHPMAGVAMTFPNTRLNECLHSVKKIDQWVRFGDRSKKKIVFFSVTEINLWEGKWSNRRGLSGGKGDSWSYLIQRKREWRLLKCNQHKWKSVKTMFKSGSVSRPGSDVWRLCRVLWTSEEGWVGSTFSLS